MTIGMELGLSTDHIVLDGDTARLSKETQPPIFNPFLLRPNCWMPQDAIWYGSRPRPRPHCIRWEPSSPPQRRRRSPQFSASVYCGQTAGRIKMPLGTVVNLVRDDIVQHGVAAPPKRGTAPAQFSAHVYRGQTAGWLRAPLGTEVILTMSLQCQSQTLSQTF